MGCDTEFWRARAVACLRPRGEADLTDSGAARWWAPLAVAVPLVVGWAVGAVLLVRGDEHGVHLHAPLWVTVVTIGLVLAAAVAVVVGLRWSRARNRKAASAALEKARQQWYVETRAKDAAFLARLDASFSGPTLAMRSAVAALGRPTNEPSEAVANLSVRIADMAASLGLLADVENRDLDLTHVELVPVIERVADAIRGELPLVGAGPRDILVLSPSQPVVITGVEDLLFGAIHHLVTNAAKFSDPGTTITVHCVQDGAGAVVEVSDMGRGIPDAETLDVWEPLARASNAGQTPGAGIGLSIVRAIVERHGGRVNLSSRLGEGTSVVMWLR